MSSGDERPPKNPPLSAAVAGRAVRSPMRDERQSVGCRLRQPLRRTPAALTPRGTGSVVRAHHQRDHSPGGAPVRRCRGRACAPSPCASLLDLPRAGDSMARTAVSVYEHRFGRRPLRLLHHRPCPQSDWVHGSSRHDHQGPRVVDEFDGSGTLDVTNPANSSLQVDDQDRQHRHPQRRPLRSPEEQRLLRYGEVPRDHVPEHGH